MRSLFRKPEFLIALVAVWFTVAGNFVPVRDVLDAAIAAGGSGAGIRLLLPLAVAVLTCLVLLLTAPPPVTRLLLVLFLLLAAPVSYFVANHGLLFDADMLGDVVETNPGEASELLSYGLFGHVLLFGLVPALLVWKYPLARRSPLRAAAERLGAIALVVVLAAAIYVSGGRELTATVRNHRDVRYQLVPANVMLAGISLVRDALASPSEFRSVAADARLADPSARNANRRTKVTVVVVGETARAQNFSLNGYYRDTNPELRQLPVVYYSQVSACGTSTRISLPCMFSAMSAADFDADQARYQDNLLDIAERAGYEVYWIDNGNSCKHVCDRVRNVNLTEAVVKHDELPDAAALCDNHFCFDEVLVGELDQLLGTIDHDALIVLHQIGSHGPAYFRRYPDNFRIFTPDCRSTDFNACTPEEIRNAYDNTIRYTDHVVASLIKLLQSQSGPSGRLDSSLLYLSDHGESLGESGLYLHGMPRAFAPAEQLHIPMVYWDSTRGDGAQGDPVVSPVVLSQDNVFHTLLGMLGVATTVYRPELDILRSKPG